MPDKFLSTNVALFKILGTYPLGNDASFFQKFWHKFMKYSSILSIYSMLIPVVLSLVFDKRDIVGWALSVLNIGIYSSSALTLHILQNSQDKIRDLIEDINKSFKMQSDDGIEKVSMNYTNKLVRIVTLYWYTAITICAQIMAFSPMFSNSDDERVLAVPAWYPFDWQQDPMYKVIFTIQCMGQFTVTNIYGMADTLIMSLLLVTGKQIELLGHNFENSVYYTLIRCGVPQETVLEFSKNFQSSYNVENYDPGEKSKIWDCIVDEIIKSNIYKEELQYVTKANVSHHQFLINFNKNLENLLWPLMTIKVLASMSYHTLICFLLVFNSNQAFLYTLGQYEIMAMYEFLLLSYFGQYLINKGENLQNQVYSGPWYINGKEYNSSLLLVLKGCFTPQYLSVGKMAKLSLATFLALVRTSTSYFTILRQTVQR